MLRVVKVKLLECESQTTLIRFFQGPDNFIRIIDLKFWINSTFFKI